MQEAPFCSVLNWKNGFNYDPCNDDAPIQIQPRRCWCVFIHYSNCPAISPLERRKQAHRTDWRREGKLIRLAANWITGREGHHTQSLCIYAEGKQCMEILLQSRGCVQHQKQSLPCIPCSSGIKNAGLQKRSGPCRYTSLWGHKHHCLSYTQWNVGLTTEHLKQKCCEYISAVSTWRGGGVMLQHCIFNSFRNKVVLAGRAWVQRKCNSTLRIQQRRALCIFLWQ